MRHASVQVRGLLFREELDRYERLWEIGKYLESQKQFEMAYVIQQEIEILIAPAIERLKDKSKQRDADEQVFLEGKQLSKSDNCE